MSQSQPLRIEDNTVTSFVTSRTINSALWFVNNAKFQKRVLGYLAKYQQKYSVILYSVVYQGNHFHINAHFPLQNRGNFFRDLNARTAESVRFTVDEFPGGPVFARRYSEQGLILDVDIEEKFFYCALQPVNAGLCERISDYPGYNSFSDATSQITRYYEVVDWASYNRTKRFNKNVRIKDFIEYYPLVFTRIPNYNHLSKQEYKKEMLRMLEERRVRIVKENKEKGVIYGDSSWLRLVKPGSLPQKTKKSRRYDYRPLYICADPAVKQWKLGEYFGTFAWYKRASKAYLAGDEYVKFPPGTYKPPFYLVKPTNDPPNAK